LAQSYQDESSGDIERMINQPKNVKQYFNIVSKFAHTMDNDGELVTLVQPLIGNTSLVATKSWPNPLIVLFFTFIRDSINFK
jgi:hypothetical protein